MTHSAVGTQVNNCCQFNGKSLLIKSLMKAWFS